MKLCKILILILLVTVENERMNNFLRDHIRVNSWIGLNDQGHEGRFQWAHEDWQLHGYKNWDTPDLSVSGFDNDCVYMMQSRDDRDGKWINTICNEEMAFVCERRSSNNRQTEAGKC